MLSKRQEFLLNFIVREYIKTARPVPSALVSKKADIKISSATIRNEMNELETDGYLIQRHTSGGRVPTDKAYRYYVNQLLDDLSGLAINPRDKKNISSTLTKAGNNSRVINKAIAKVLSECSGNLVIAGIAQDAEFFKQGLVSLFKYPEFREVGDLFQLASFFEEFEGMFQFIEREFFNTLGVPHGVPVQILIGGENPFKQIRHETIMCAKYGLPGNCIGSLTLIGPTRMDYEKNISLVKYLTEELNKLY